MSYYSDWLSRAESFVRSLDNLPGQWGINIALEPPLSSREAIELSNKLPFGLPGPLHELYTTASAGCSLTYFWEPDTAHLPLVGKIFPDQYSLYGGPRFLPAAELEDAHVGVRNWATGWNETANALPRPGWELWHQAIPFLAVGNGDYIALHITNDPLQLPVLYLCHDAHDDGDGKSAFEISPSFEQFLADWEKIFYIGPEIWLLHAFLTEDGQGPILVEQLKTTLWRKLISDYSHIQY